MSNSRISPHFGCVLLGMVWFGLLVFLAHVAGLTWNSGIKQNRLKVNELRLISFRPLPPPPPPPPPPAHPRLQKKCFVIPFITFIFNLNIDVKSISMPFVSFL